MSEDKHSVSLEMLFSQLNLIDTNMRDLLKKRHATSFQLLKLLAGDDNLTSASTLSSLQQLAILDDAAQTLSLRSWASSFTGDIAASGLEKVLVSGAEPLRIWDQARALFGHDIQMTFDADPREALTYCADHENSAVVLGWMTLAGSGQWWPVLNESKFHNLRIMGVWPVCHDKAPYAAVIGHGPLNTPVGNSTLLIAHDDHHKVSKIFGDIDLIVNEFGRARSLVLFEINERIAEGDPRLKAAKIAGLDGLRVVGALPRYNRPEN